MSQIEEKAAIKACEMLRNPTAPEYTDEHIRDFQGCPTIATTKGGRIYLGWYSGGRCEPHIDNFNLIVKSDDGGKSWSKPLLVIKSSRTDFVQALDIQLFTAPDGKLYVFWVQNNVKPAGVIGPDGKLLYTGYTIDGFVFRDQVHAEWVSVCDNPDADEPVFSAPRYFDKGFLRCKPLVLDDGRWVNFNYDQTSDRYGYSVSADCDETCVHHYGAVKIPTPFDEGMAYQKRDGSIRMFARTSVGYTAESTAKIDVSSRELIFSEASANEIPNPNTRLYISRTPSGRIILVGNDDEKSRCRMTVYLSDDDGETFRYKRCIDERNSLSYPDVDFYGGRVYLTYDRERSGEGSAKEILFADFTEDDIINPTAPIQISIVSKP